LGVSLSQEGLSSSEYPVWLFFFPMYLMLFLYALLGRTGFIIVADSFEGTSFPASEFALYYILTYGLVFPVIFIGQFLYYRILSRRCGIYWKNFSRSNRVLILAYDVLGFLFYLWAERIFGVNAPYDTSFDFSIGSLYIWWGDIIIFFIAFPLFMIGFHGINYAICRQIGDRRKYQFFIVVLGTAVLGTITQDWFWWISAPNPPWGPGVTIYFSFTGWITIPFLELYIPVIYLIVAVVSLTVLFLATLRLYSVRQYLLWCVGPYLGLVLIGNILFYVF